MISRNRSTSTAAAMSIDRTTSANNAVTCLYSAERLTCVTGAPHSLQNLEFGGRSTPHEPHDSPEAVMAPSWHRLGPRHMPLEAKRSGHIAIALLESAVGVVVAVGAGQQRTKAQQPDVAHHHPLL